jgi:hypothetical protein
MRSGNANRCLGVSGIFHSKRLNNDGQRSASSRLLSLKSERFPAVMILFYSVALHLLCKSFIAQSPATSKFNHAAK